MRHLPKRIANPTEVPTRWGALRQAAAFEFLGTRKQNLVDGTPASVWSPSEWTPRCLGLGPHFADATDKYLQWTQPASMVSANEATMAVLVWPTNEFVASGLPRRIFAWCTTGTEGRDNPAMHISYHEGNDQFQGRGQANTRLTVNSTAGLKPHREPYMVIWRMKPDATNMYGILMAAVALKGAETEEHTGNVSGTSIANRGNLHLGDAVTLDREYSGWIHGAWLFPVALPLSLLREWVRDPLAPYRSKRVIIVRPRVPGMISSGVPRSNLQPHHKPEGIYSSQ
jgi:hypothetical protein